MSNKPSGAYSSYQLFQDSSDDQENVEVEVIRKTSERGTRNELNAHYSSPVKHYDSFFDALNGEPQKPRYPDEGTSSDAHPPRNAEVFFSEIIKERLNKHGSTFSTSSNTSDFYFDPELEKTPPQNPPKKSRSEIVCGLRMRDLSITSPKSVRNVCNRSIKGILVLGERDQQAFPPTELARDLSQFCIDSHLPCSPSTTPLSISENDPTLNRSNVSRYNELSSEARGVYLDWLSIELEKRPSVPTAILQVRHSMLAVAFVAIAQSDITERNKLEIDMGGVSVTQIYQEIFDEINLIHAMTDAPKLKSSTARTLAHIFLFEPFLNRSKDRLPNTGSTAISNFEIGLDIAKKPVFKVEHARLRLVSMIEALSTGSSEGFKRANLELGAKVFEEFQPNGVQIPYDSKKLAIRFEPDNSFIFASLGVDVLQKRRELSIDSNTIGVRNAMSVAYNTAFDLLKSTPKKRDQWGNNPYPYLLLSKDLDPMKKVAIGSKDIFKDLVRPLTQRLEQSINDNGGCSFLNPHQLLSVIEQSEAKPDRKINKVERDLISSLLNKQDTFTFPDGVYYTQTIPAECDYMLTDKPKSMYSATPSKLFDYYSTLIFVLCEFKGCVSHISDLLSELDEIIDGWNGLPATEKDLIQGSVRWQLYGKHPKKAIKSLVTSLGEDKQEDIFKHTVRVIMCDGILNKQKLTDASKLLKKIGLGSFDLNTAIHQLNSRGASSISRNQATSSNTKTERKPLFDLSKVHQIQQETSEVQSMLGEVFTESEPESSLPVDVSTPPEVKTETSAKSQYEGLSLPLSQLLEILIEHNELAFSEFELLCSDRKILPSGAIEQINEWSYQLTDYPLIEEDGDSIAIDQDTLDEIKQGQ